MHTHIHPPTLQFMRAAVEAHPSTHLLAHALASEVQRQRCSSSSSVAMSAHGEGVASGAESRTTPVVRLRPLLERAAATRQLSTSPELWFMYLRWVCLARPRVYTCAGTCVCFTLRWICYFPRVVLRLLAKVRY
jgi:hypothetical protein